MSEFTLQVLALIAIIINALVMIAVTVNSCLVQRKVTRFTSQQEIFDKAVLDDLETFSKIYIGIEAKINSTDTKINVIKKGIADSIKLQMLTGRIVLETKQSLSAFISTAHPEEAHLEGKITGAAEEAVAMAKAHQESEILIERAQVGEDDPQPLPDQTTLIEQLSNPPKN